MTVPRGEPAVPPRRAAARRSPGRVRVGPAEAGGVRVTTGTAPDAKSVETPIEAAMKTAEQGVGHDTAGDRSQS